MPKSFHDAEVSGRVLYNRSIAFDAFESNRIGCGLQRPRRRIGAGEPNGIFAVRSRGDQERGDDKNPYGQRDNDNDDRSFHLGPIARRAAALRAGINVTPVSASPCWP